LAKLELPDRPELASKLVESHTRQSERRLEMGIIGALFGKMQEKPGNVAGFAIIVSLLLLILILWSAIFGQIATTCL
jgi:hypothetical protein